MRKTLGLVLKRQDIGETDRIVTIFSPDLGKKRVIAKAVRRPLSKIAGHLDTFMLSQLILTDSPDLPRITSAVLAEPFEDIRSSLPQTERAFAISKIIERTIIEDVPQRPIFQLTLDALARLNADRNWVSTWLYFLNELTDELGLGATDFTCQKCGQRIATGANYLFDDRRLICQNCTSALLDGMKLEANTIKLLQLLRKNPFLTIEKITIPQINAEQVEELLLREITQWFNKPWGTYSELRNGRNSKS